MSNWRKTKSEPSTTRWQRRHRRLLTSHESRGTQSPLRACSLVSDWPPGTHENGLCRGPLTYLGEGRGEKEARGKKEVRCRVASVCVGGERRCERRCASFFRFFFLLSTFFPFPPRPSIAMAFAAAPARPHAMLCTTPRPRLITGTATSSSSSSNSRMRRIGQRLSMPSAPRKRPPPTTTTAASANPPSKESDPLVRAARSAASAAAAAAEKLKLKEK